MNQKIKINNPIREAVIYILWLVGGMVAGMFVMFLVAALIFQTKQVPPEAAAISIWPAMFIVTLLRLKKVGGGLSDISLSVKRSSFAKLVVGILLGAIFMIVAFVVLDLSSAIMIQKQVLSSTLVFGAIVSLAYTLIQSGTEEVIFRGYLFKTLMAKNKNFALLVTATLFSLAHFWHGVDPIGWLNIFLFGVFAAQLVLLTKSLWTAIGFHVGWNYLQWVVLGFPVYGSINTGFFQTTPLFDNRFTGGNYGPEGSLIITALLILSIGLIYMREKELTKMPETATN